MKESHSQTKGRIHQPSFLHTSCLSLCGNLHQGIRSFRSGMNSSKRRISSQHKGGYSLARRNKFILARRNAFRWLSLQCWRCRLLIIIDNHCSKFFKRQCFLFFMCLYSLLLLSNSFYNLKFSVFVNVHNSLKVFWLVLMLYSLNFSLQFNVFQNSSLYFRISSFVLFKQLLKYLDFILSSFLFKLLVSYCFLHEVMSRAMFDLNFCFSCLHDLFIYIIYVFEF